MITARKAELITPEEYLATELDSPVKHEYVGGVVYAMAGARNAHNQIAGNVFGRLHARLLESSCQPFNSDTKVRIKFPTHQRFYYPDVMVVCLRNPADDSYQDNPVIIVEVTSAKTRRTDEGEKKEAYLAIASLDLYLTIEQETPMVVAYRRTDEGFVREVFQGLQAILPLPSIKTELTLSEIYRGVEFLPEPEEEL